QTLEEYSGKICGKDFGLCVNPEFLREGNAVHDMLNPSKIIIGSDNREAAHMLKNFYLNFYREECPPILITNFSTAEMIKYANNAFLATKISFINEIANICESIPGADVKIVAKALGLDSRINPKFLNAGLGFGGSCFPKDVKAIIQLSHELRYTPKILEAVLEVNEQQPLRVIKLIKNKLGTLRGKKIAILGVAFKPETDDIREAPSLKIINALINEGANVTVYDPKALENVKKIFGNKIEYCSSTKECIHQAECCIVVTEWNEFRKLTPEDFKLLMKTPLLIDGRRMYDPQIFIDKKIQYFGIGLGST
ncbi:MAG: UDP-glucose dehydrogenase family protein, partial [Candidatus Odinarchaeia archaeon]